MYFHQTVHHQSWECDFRFPRNLHSVQRIAKQRNFNRTYFQCPGQLWFSSIQLFQFSKIYVPWPSISVVWCPPLAEKWKLDEMIKFLSQKKQRTQKRTKTQKKLGFKWMPWISNGFVISYLTFYCAFHLNFSTIKSQVAF